MGAHVLDPPVMAGRRAPAWAFGELGWGHKAIFDQYKHFFMLWRHPYMGRPIGRCAIAKRVHTAGLYSPNRAGRDVYDDGVKAGCGSARVVAGAVRHGALGRRQTFLMA